METQVVITGGYTVSKKVNIYNMYGLTASLPDLNTGRNFHGCGYYRNSDNQIVQYQFPINLWKKYSSHFRYMLWLAEVGLFLIQKFWKLEKLLGLLCLTSYQFRYQEWPVYLWTTKYLSWVTLVVNEKEIHSILIQGDTQVHGLSWVKFTSLTLKMKSGLKLVIWQLPGVIMLRVWWHHIG